MAIMPKVMYPFMDGLSNENDSERLQQLAQYILLTTGTPTDWGDSCGAIPANFGLASNNTGPYSLDADKITRLNSENCYAITYAQLLEALKVSNVALGINIQPIFNTSVALLSNVNKGSQTSYNFTITTEDSGLAVASNLSNYFIVGNYVNNTVVSTDSSGKGVASFIVPNSVNGSALLIVFARAQADSSVVSYEVYSFGHNASTPKPNETFARLSPLNRVLNASFNYSDERVSGAYAFSYDNWTDLTQFSSTKQTAEYSFPRFLDRSATILVLTGFNGTKSFAEWVAYPQIPLSIGTNFDSSTSTGDVASFTYIVTINSALYSLQIKCMEVD
jgi:hypothetical protein